MNSTNCELDFVKPNKENTIYREDQKELIKQAFIICKGNQLNTLLYFVTCMNRAGHNIEFEMIFTIPANKEVSIMLPIIECDIKDNLGYYVNWGDEITHNINIHTYKKLDKLKKYHVKFFGLNITSFGMQNENNQEYAEYLTDVLSFGNLGHTFTSLKFAFYKCQNNFTIPQILPSSIIDINNIFRNCKNFNQPLHTWNTCNIINMYGAFRECVQFNQPLNNWNVSKVKDMSYMFFNCIIFNQILDKWDTSNVKNMSFMFGYCNNYNKSLNMWNVSNVKNMSFMFSYCINFNQPLNTWNTSNVELMGGMFKHCIVFNQPLYAWNTSKVRNMYRMFLNCTEFNQNLNNWDISNVTNICNIFRDCINFNQPLNLWNTSKITDMRCAFYGCSKFNQSLNKWNTINVIDAYGITFNSCIDEENEPIFI